MTGRTNVGGGGLAINAEVETKTVAAGSIVAGDFVQYYTEPEYIEQSSLVNFKFAINGYMTAIKDNLLVLFKNNTQVATYSEYYAKAICKYGDFIILYSGVNEKVVTLNINTSTDQITKVSEITLSGGTTAASNGYAIEAGNGKVVACSVYATSSGKLVFFVIDISNSGILSNAVVTNYNQSSAGPSLFIDFYNNNFYVMNNGYTSSLSSYYRLYSISIANDGTVTDLQNIIIINDNMNIAERQYKNNNIVIYSASSSGNNGLYIIDFENVTLVGRSLLGGHPTNFENNLLVTSQVSGGKRILRLYFYNNTTKEITLLDTHTNDTDNSNTGDGYILGNDLIVYDHLTDSKYYYGIYVIKDSNTIQLPQDTDKVIPWSDSGDAIGVAKQSGQTNDEIDVYISGESEYGGVIQTKNAVPYTTPQVVTSDPNYFLGKVNIAAISYVEESNSAGGKTVTIGMVAPVPT